VDDHRVRTSRSRIFERRDSSSTSETSKGSDNVCDDLMSLNDSCTACSSANQYCRCCGLPRIALMIVRSCMTCQSEVNIMSCTRWLTRDNADAMRVSGAEELGLCFSTSSIDRCRTSRSSTPVSESSASSRRASIRAA
jgi:hypothetical protein